MVMPAAEAGLQRGTLVMLLAFEKQNRRPASAEEEEKIAEEELKKFTDQYGFEPEYEETSFLTAAFRQFDAFPSVERLARAIAIFNWLSDSLGTKFPAWPADCKPILSPVVAELGPDEVVPPK